MIQFACVSRTSLVKKYITSYYIYTLRYSNRDFILCENVIEERVNLIFLINSYKKITIISNIVSITNSMNNDNIK